MNGSWLRATLSPLALCIASAAATPACGGATLESFPSPTADAGGSGEPDDAGKSSADSAASPDSGACTPQVSPTTCGANVTFPCGIVSGTDGTPLDTTTCQKVCGSSTASNCYVYESVTAGDSVFIPCGPCGVAG